MHYNLKIDKFQLKQCRFKIIILQFSSSIDTVSDELDNSASSNVDNEQSELADGESKRRHNETSDDSELISVSVYNFFGLKFFF